MAIFKSDWAGELDQVKATTKDIVEEQIAPMINLALGRAGRELKAVVGDASEKLQQNIEHLASEVHNQRQLTNDQLMKLIDYAADRIGQTVDDRLTQAKVEASNFMSEKIEQVKSELAQASRISRRTIYMNVCISLAGALGMAVVGFLYKKLGTGELDLLSVFRVLLLSTATGSGLLSLLKMWGQWRSMSVPQRNVASIALTQLSVLRPNGAMGPFLLAVVMLLGWFGVAYLPR